MNLPSRDTGDVQGFLQPEVVTLCVDELSLASGGWRPGCCTVHHTTEDDLPSRVHSPHVTGPALGRRAARRRGPGRPWDRGGSCEEHTESGRGKRRTPRRGDSLSKGRRGLADGNVAECGPVQGPGSSVACPCPLWTPRDGGLQRTSPPRADGHSCHHGPSPVSLGTRALCPEAGSPLGCVWLTPLSGAPVPLSKAQQEEQNLRPAAWLAWLRKVCEVNRLLQGRPPAPPLGDTAGCWPESRVLPAQPPRRAG